MSITLKKQEDRQLIIISTSRGNFLPYTYDGRGFYRNQSTTMRMPQTRYSQLLLERGTQSHNAWETQWAKEAKIDDLDFEEIRHTLKIGANTNRLNAEALNDPIKDTLILFLMIV